MLSLRVEGKTSRKEFAGMWREWRSSRGRSGIGKGTGAEDLAGRVSGE